MAYKLTVLDGALEDLDEAVEWYAEISSSLPIDIASLYKTALNEIQHKPLVSTKLRSGYRKVNLERFPYKIVFKILEEEILVVAVAHHKRKPNYWKNR